MGFLANTLSAWILGSGGLYAVDDDGARRWTYTGNPAKAVAIAGDGPLQMWLARSEAPEIERMTFGSGKLSPAATYSVTGNPVAIAARDGEAWAAAADGTLTKAGGSAVAAGMDLAAIAVGPDAVWGIGSAAKLVRVPRSGGSPVQIDVGTEPRGLAIDADGAAWVACRASVTVASGSQVVKTAALASVPTGIVTSARHVCIGSANRLAFYNLDGTPAGNFTLPFEPQFLGTDSLDRVWACNALLGECVTVWGR